MEETGQNAQSFADYQAGLEESIRRCEELLSCTPLTFLPPRRGSRNSISAKDSYECYLYPGSDDLTNVSASQSAADVLSVTFSSPPDKTCSENLREAVSDTCFMEEGRMSSVKTFPPSDVVQITIETNMKNGHMPEACDQPKPPLKFCPLDTPSRKTQRGKKAPKESQQHKNTREFFTAISEVMDNLKSYIHCPSRQQDSNATGKERLNNLSKPRTEVYKRLALVKQIIEDKQLKECSFKPVVTKKLDSAPTAHVLERLADAQHQKEVRKRVRKAVEKEELASCSFRPQINQNSPYYERSDLTLPERFKELEARRREKIEKAMKEQEQYTFKPEINSKSLQIFKERGLDTVDLADRLRTMSHSVHIDCKNDIEAMNATFSPEINRNTDEILACSQHFGGFAEDFLSRQQHCLRSQQEKRKQKENEVPSDFTFSPNIGNSDFILKQTVPFGESFEERVQRLAYKDKASQIQARKKVADDYYGQFNFQPEIDEVSRLVGRTSNISDLHLNRKGQELKKELEQAAEFEFQQKCPFRPMTFAAHEGDRTCLKNSFLERLQARKEQYSSTMQESWTLRELEEIKECTFKPAVNRIRPKDEPPKIVKGLDRYFELQQIAKQMKQDHENLEKKVFFSHVSSLPIRQYTIPKPFSFTEHSKHDAKPGSPESQ